MRSGGTLSIARALVFSFLFLLLSASTSGPAGAADLEQGAELFDLCAQCHGPTGGGNQLFLAPSISGLEEWYIEAQLQRFKSGARGTHPADVGGLRMHPMSLSLKSDEQIGSVAAYVASLPAGRPEAVLTGGDPARGATLYVTCAACHPQGEGNRTINSPSLLRSSDWYLLSSLEKYKSGVRGGNPQNVNAVMMRGMAIQLVDEQAMKDVVAYIMTLRDTQ